MKKRILFISAHRPNRSPSQRFRYEQYLDYLENNGFSCELSYLISAEDDKKFYSAGNYLFKLWFLLRSLFVRMRDVWRASKYDYVFIQREAFMLGTSLFEWALSKTKAKLIYDFDDSIWLPMNDHSVSNQNLQWLKKPTKTNAIIRCSDLVIAGNKFLADYALKFNPNVVIFPTTIDTEKYKPEFRKSRAKVCIGWSGSFTTINHFKIILPVLKRIRDKYGDLVYFRVIGDSKFSDTELQIQGIPWNKNFELEILQEFDIGIMPLPDNAWAWGKCGLKGLQYMALQIPTIMSAVGVNKEIIQHGENGFLAYSEDEWFSFLCKLIDDEPLRLRIGARGRQTVVDHYSFSSQKEKYKAIFDQLTHKKV